MKLEIKVVQPGDELHFRRVASDNYELFGEEPFDDKPAAVVFHSGLTKHLLKADVLLFIKPERVFITRRLRFLFGFVGLFSVGIHNIG